MDLCGVEQAEQTAESIVPEDAGVEAEELAHERFLGTAEQRHLGAVIDTAQHGAKSDNEDFVPVVPRVVSA